MAGTKPTVAVEVNSGHSLAANLKGAWIFQSLPCPNLVTAVNTSASGGVSIVADPDNGDACVQFAATSDYIDVTEAAISSPLDPKTGWHTLYVVANFGTTAAVGGQAFAYLERTTATDKSTIQFSTASNSLQASLDNGGGTGAVTEGSDSRDGLVHTCAWVRDSAGGGLLYRDGSNVGTMAPGTAAYTSMDSDVFTIGNNKDASYGLRADARIHAVYYFDKDLSPAEITALEADVYALFQPIGGGDSTAPTYGTSPAVSAVTNVQITAGATASDETSSTVNHYAVVVAAGATAPSAAQVKAGNDSTDSAAIASGSDLTVSNGVAGSIALSGLTGNTAYDVYYCVEDVAENLTSVTLLNQTTQSATATVSSITGGTSLTGLSYTVFDGYNIGTSAILKQGTGESTDGSGNLVIDLNDVSVAASDPVTIVITDYTTSPSGSSNGAVCYTTVSIA